MIRLRGMRMRRVLMVMTATFVLMDISFNKTHTCWENFWRLAGSCVNYETSRLGWRCTQSVEMGLPVIVLLYHAMLDHDLLI
jgi:hypothetical protein